MEKIFEAKVKLEKQDVRAFILRTFGTNIMTYICIAITIVFLYNVFEESSISGYSSILVAAIVFVAFVYIIFFKNPEKICKEERNKGTYYYISDNIIKVIINEDNKSSAHFNQFHKIVETRKLFLIYANPNAANIIPKRDLSNEQIETFREIFKDTKEIKKVKLLK